MIEITANSVQKAGDGRSSPRTGLRPPARQILMTMKVTTVVACSWMSLDELKGPQNTGILTSGMAIVQMRKV